MTDAELKRVMCLIFDDVEDTASILIDALRSCCWVNDDVAPPVWNQQVMSEGSVNYSNLCQLVAPDLPALQLMLGVDGFIDVSGQAALLPQVQRLALSGVAAANESGGMGTSASVL